MKLTLVLATALLTLTMVPAPAAGHGDGVVVHFALTLGSHAGASHKTCDVEVAPGSDGGDVLDAAARDGCISGWTYDDSFGPRFVTCIDGICGQNVENTVGTFWAFYLDEQLPCGGGCGIDDVEFFGGETAEFVYADWFTPFMLPL